MKKTLLFLLVVSMLLISLAGCNNQTSSPNDTDDNTYEEESRGETDEWGRPVVEDSVPDDLKFTGETLTILTRNQEHYMREWYSEDPQDALDQAIFERNEYVQERLEIEIEFVPSDCYWEQDNCAPYNNLITNDYMSGLGEYDVVSHYAMFAVGEALRDCYANWYDQESFPYFDLSKPWWNQGMLETGTVQGQLYYMVGDANLSVFDRMFVIYYNVSLGENFGLPNMYDIALDGDWTYEKLLSYSKDIYVDQDTSIEGESDGDVFGLVTLRWVNAYHSFYHGFDLNMVEKQEDGTYALKTSGLELFDNALTAIHDLYYSGYEGVHLILTESAADQVSAFAESRAVFSVEIMYRNAEQNQQFRDMKDEYGILPMPKWDDLQKEYTTGSEDCHNLVSIMNHVNKNGELISAALELLYAESYRTVRPYYFEKMVKYKYFKSAEATQVFEMVLDSASFDFAYTFDKQMGSIFSKLWVIPADEGFSIAGAFAAYREMVEEKIASMNEWYLERA